MGKQQEAAEASRRNYIQTLNKLTLCIVSGNIRNLKNICESLYKTICSVNREVLLSVHNDTANPLFQSNIIIFCCEKEQYSALEYLLTAGDKKLLKLYEKIGVEFIHPKCTNSFMHNALYYAIRSNNVKMVDLLIEKWPGFDLGKNVECFERALSQSYHDLKLRNVKISSEMEFYVGSKLLDFRLDINGKRSIPGVTVQQITARVDWLISKIQGTLEDNSDDQVEILLQNLKTIAKNIHVLKGLLRSTYDVIPWEEMEFCLVTFVRIRISNDALSVLYRSFITKAALMVHLKNFTDCLMAEKIGILSSHSEKDLKSFPSIKRDQAVEMITQKYPFFQSLYHDFHRSRDIRSLAIMNECMDTCLSANVEEKNGCLIIVRTLQVIGQCFHNTFESPMLTDETSKKLISNLDRNTRKIIIGIRNSLSSSLELSTRAEKEDEDTIGFFSELLIDIGKLNNIVRIMINSEIFRQIKRKFRILKNCDEIDTYEEIISSFSLKTFEDLAVSGSIAMLQLLLDKVRHYEKISPQAVSLINIVKSSLGKVIHSLVTDKVLELQAISMQQWVKSLVIDVTNSYGLETIRTISKELVDISADYEELKLSRSLGFAVIDFLSSTSARLSKDEYFDVYMLASEIINVIDIVDDNTKWNDELHTKLKNHNKKFPFDYFEPYPSPEIVRKNVNNMKKIKNDAISKLVSDITGVFSDCCNDKTKSYQIQHGKEGKGTKLILELLIVAMLNSGRSKEYSNHDNLYVDAKVPLLYGQSLLNYLTHKCEIMEISLHKPATCVINFARIIALKKAVGNRGFLNYYKQEFNDVDALIEQDCHISKVVGFQQQLFHALSEGSMRAVNRCLDNGADIFGRNYNNAAALHYAASGPSPECLKYVLDQWKGKIDEKNTEGLNSLHLAVYHGRVDNVKFLLNQGKIPVDAPDDFGRTSLHYSVSTKYTNITNMLLTFNADPNALDENGTTPLKQALRSKNIKASKLILEHKKFCYDITIGSPLDVAAEMGLSELLPALIRLESDVSHKNRNRKSSKAIEPATPLHYAAANGHTECIKILLQNGWNVNAIAYNGDTPLYCSAMSDNEDAVRFMLEKGANVNAGKPFLMAAHKGNVNIVEMLIANKFSVNTVEPSSGKTALHFAALSNSRDVVELLVKKGARINAKDNNGRTALHCSAQRRYNELTKVLMNCGAKTNISDKFGRFPHFHATLDGNQEIVELMVTSSNVNAVDPMGYTALHFGCNEGYEGIVRYLLAKGAKVHVKANSKITPLHLAAKNGFHGIVNLLLDANASIDDTDSLGRAPIHYAAAFGWKEVMEILIKRGGNVNRSTSCGHTPLYLACSNGSLECTSLLIDSGASLNIMAQDGTTPLRMSVTSNNKSVVELLVKNKVKIDDGAVEKAVQYGFGDILELMLNRTPAIVKNTKWLFLAALECQSTIIRLLTNRGADINGKHGSSKGGRPLHSAVCTGDAEIVQLLIELGADLSLKSNAGRTPLYIATKLGYFEIIKVLLNHKSEILAVSSDGRTSLDVAVENGETKAVELFLNHDKTININTYFSTAQRWPLLHTAVRSGRLNVVQLLVEKGADINCTIDSGSKALHIAAREGFTDIVDFFLSKGMGLYDCGTDGNNVLHNVAFGRGDRLEVAKLLVRDKNMDVNKVNNDGWTPLHFAVRESEDKQLVKFLMENGAYYDLKDFRGNATNKIPTSFSIRLIFHSVLNLLNAAKRGHLAQVRNSIRQGAVVDAKNERNETALLCATWKGKADVVIELLANGANPDLAGKSGSTPLHYAAKASRYTIALELLGRGAIFESYNEGNKTPLNYAADDEIRKVLKLIECTFLKVKLGDIEVLKSLRKIKLKPDEVKALVNCKDQNGKTLVASAMIAKFPDVIGLQSIFHDNKNFEKVEKIFSLGNYREALMLVQSERTLRKAMFTDDSMMNRAVDLMIILSLYEEQRYNDALREQQKLYHTTRKMLGKDSELAVKIESLEALLLGKKGESMRALKLFETVIEKQLAVLGPLHPDLINTQINMGITLQSLGKFKTALKLCRDLVERCKLIHGSDHPLTMSVQTISAEILIKQDRYDEALEILKHVLEKYNKILGPNSREILQTKFAMGEVYFAQKKCKLAVEMIEDSMKIHPGIREKFDGWSKSKVKRYIFELMNFGDIFNVLNNQFDRRGAQLGPRGPGSVNMFERRDTLGSGMFLNDEDREYELPSFNVPGSPFNLLEFFSELHFLRVMGLIGDGRWTENEEGFFGNVFDRMTTNSSSDSEVDEDISDYAFVDEKIDITTALHAIANGDLDIVEKMIYSEIDFNSTDEEGRTPLHYAVSSGNVRLINSLIENGADVTVKSKKGNTPLHSAALSGREDITEVILRNVKDTAKNTFVDSQTTKGGMTALHIAAMKGKFEVVKILLKNGATFNATNTDQKSPLDLSVNEEVTSTLKRLDNLFKTVAASVNSLKELSSDDWDNMKASRNAEGDSLLTEIMTCKDVFDRLVCENAEPKIPPKILGSDKNKE